MSQPSGNNAPEILRLTLAVVGTGLIGVGGYLYSPPIGFAAAGGLMYITALLSTVMARR